ncbi:hypothetical protein [Parasphingorhabdus sp.]|uniref:hypothetical protein n=1 Tax=Parasphingorhabdus sp. TaxID=2709688 RepID=UPI003C723474
MPRFLNMPLTFIAILAVTACAASETPAAEREPDPEESVLEDEAIVSDDEDTVRIRIDGFECGDNCYLDFTELAPAEGDDPAEESQTALCNVDACIPWFEEQEMLPEFIGSNATATIGTGEQVDNEGNVMSEDFPKILSITLDPVG